MILPLSEEINFVACISSGIYENLLFSVVKLDQENILFWR